MRTLFFLFFLLLFPLPSLFAARPYKQPILPDSLQSVFDSLRIISFSTRIEDAFSYLNRLKNANTRQESHLQAVIAMQEGILYSKLEYYDQAEKLLLQAIELFEQTKQDYHIASCYYALGVVVEGNDKNHIKQLAYFEKSLPYYLASKDTFRIICAYDAIGSTWSALGNQNKALENSFFAKSLMESNLNKWLEPNVYANIGSYYLALNEYARAREFLEKSYFYYEKGYDSPEAFRYEAYRLLGETYLGLGMRVVGERFLRVTIDYCKQNPENSPLTKSVFGALRKLYLSEKNYVKALELEQDYNSLLEDASKQATLLRYHRNQVLFEVNAKERERQRLESTLKTQNQRNNLTIFITVLLGALLIALFFLYRQKQRFNKTLEREIAQKTQALKESNIELERFVFIASHDLRTPLRNVISFSTLLERKLKNNDDPNIKQYITFIKDYAYHMGNIIDDILDFSKLEQTEKLIESTPIEEAKDQVLKLLNDPIKEKKAIVIVAPDLPSVKMERTHLIQLLQNLVENALTYNDKQYPQIRIGLGKESTETHIHIFVRDNGIGIEEQYKEKVFDMFARLHTIQEYPGTGLGLAICKKIVSSYGGKIWLESEKNAGSTFHFTLPI
jgi:signal transduction histidine kinase